jgi:hypothetical protein
MEVKIEEEIVNVINSKKEQTDGFSKNDTTVHRLTDILKEVESVTNTSANISYINIVKGFLTDKYTLIIKNQRLYDESLIYISKPDGSILLEPNMLIRMINNINKLVLLTDDVLSKPNRQEGIDAVFNLFQKKKFFQFLKLIEADYIEVMVLITLISLQINEHHNRSYEPQELCKYLPKSSFITFYNRLVSGTSVIVNQQLVNSGSPKEKGCFFLNLHPRTYSLLGNEAIVPI